MPTEYYRTVRRRFSWAVAFVLLLLLLVFCWHSAREYRFVISGAETRSASFVNALKEHAERVFVEADNSLKDLIEEIDENGGISYVRTARFHALLGEKARTGPRFSSLYVADHNADIIAHSLSAKLNPVNLAERDYFRYHRDNPGTGLYISKPFLSKVSNTWRFSLSRALRDGHGNFAGIVSATFETGYFENFYKNIEVGSRGKILLATRSGDLLVQEPLAGDQHVSSLKGSRLFSQHVPYAQAGTFHNDEPRTSRIISYSTLQQFPVVSAVSLDKAEVTAPWLAHIYHQIFLGVLLVVLVIVLSMLFLRQVQKLEQAKLALEAHQEALEARAMLLDSASDAILLLDENGRLVYFNNALCAISGRGRAELENIHIQDIEPPEYAEKVVDNIRMLATIADAVFESAYLHKSGSTIPVEVHARLIEIGQQRLVLSVVRDISERKNSERQIMTVVKEWQGTFDSVADAVWLLDMDRKIVRANHASIGIFGMTPEELIGMDCCSAAHAEMKPHSECPFDRMLRSGKRASMQMAIAERWFEVSVDPVFSDAGEIVNAVHIVKDITGLKRSELREHVRSDILEHISRGEPLPQLLAFIASSIEHERPEALCSILLVDGEGTHLLHGAAPSLPEFYNKAVHGIRIGEGIGSCGTAAFRRERVVVEDITTHAFWKGFKAAQEAGLRSCWSEPVFSSDGTLLGTFAIYQREPAIPGEDEIRLIELASAYAGIAIERSRYEAERSRLEEQLGQLNKMEAIGHLAGGIAHDFNNLLTPILIYADMLKRGLPAQDETLNSKVDGIIKASRKARDLTQQLLSFGRKQVMQMQIVDLNKILTTFHTIIRRTLRENIEIDLKLSSSPALIRADRTKLEQVILNLAINAQDAIAGPGEIIIETGQVMIDDEYAKRHPGMKTGDHVILKFSDNGCGMNEEVMLHIFEPFYTTKQPGHGTGLGLSNVYGIVKQHNGYIEVRSEPGAGTIFDIYLPLSAGIADGAEHAPPEHARDYRGGETILLVEDNEMVRTMTTELLEGLGYKVHVEGHPEHALEFVERNSDKIDLLITDVVMPSMNGQQLFERISELRPDIDKVLYMSGYTNNLIETDGALGEGVHFLQKPFTVDALMAKIKTLLHPEG